MASVPASPSAFSPTILITTPSGNVGRATLSALKEMGFPQDAIILGERTFQSNINMQTGPFWRVLDLQRPETFAPALAGIRQVLLVRPPAISQVEKYFYPFLQEARKAGVQQVVFLSIQGAEKNSKTPHHKIENHIKELGLGYTFLRPSFFMQNLTSTHREEIKNHNQIFVPAGKGKINFVDTEDVGHAAALALAYPEQHMHKTWELTGSHAYDFFQVAEMLSSALGRKITYKNPGLLSFLWRKWRQGTPLGFAFVMAAIYSGARLGRAAAYSEDLEKLIAQPPTTLQEFIARHIARW